MNQPEIPAQKRRIEYSVDDWMLDLAALSQRGSRAPCECSELVRQYIHEHYIGEPEAEFRQHILERALLIPLEMRAQLEDAGIVAPGATFPQEIFLALWNYFVRIPWYRFPPGPDAASLIQGIRAQMARNA